MSSTLHPCSGMFGVEQSVIPRFRLETSTPFKAAGVRHTCFCPHDQAIVSLNHLKQFAWALPLPPFSFLYISS